MRKPILFLSLAIVFCVFALLGGKASAQPSEEMMQEQEEMQAVQLHRVLNYGTAMGHTIFEGIDKERVGITDEQIDSVQKKIGEAFRPFNEEFQEKFGNNPRNLARDQLAGDMVEELLKTLPKANEITRQILKETLPADTIKRIENDTFQRFGGVFGGALNVDNLAPLNLTAEQREKAAKIVEKLNREFLTLSISMKMDSQLKEELGGLEFLKVLNEKLVSITRRGQREIEALLTPEQKKLAEELMADMPEQYRFLTDYLANRPWRLDESSWRPGDGPPPNLENYPGETRPQRTPGERPFPGN